MENEIYTRIKAELKDRPKQLSDLNQWLYVVVNTAKAMIDNTSKDSVDIVLRLANCDSTGQIQQEFDIMQGKFGRDGFSQRHSPNYIFLCSLAANFPNCELSHEDKELIAEYAEADTFLLYEL